MADMYSLLQAASSADNAVRNAAEAALTNAERTSTGAYFLALAQELASEARPDNVRQLAGLRMKVSLDAQDVALREERRARWKSLDAATRKAVKDLCTSTLNATGPLARAAAPQVIAKIGGIEIAPGANGWPELLPGLFGVIGNAALPEGPRAASLTALGYLLEELDEYDESPLMQEEVDAALTAICSSIQAPGTPPGVQQAATEALYNTLPFVAANFEDERLAERNSIMGAVCAATQLPVAKAKQSAFACIERIAELYYDHLAGYMEVLATLTATAARGADENVAVHALGFWTAIAEEEARRLGGESDGKVFNFVLQALKPLVDMLTAIMVDAVKEDFDEDEYGPAESAANTMIAVAAVAKDKLMELLLPFIMSNFGAAEWNKRDAALMCLALSQEGPTPANMRKVDSEALPHIFSRLAPGPTRDPSAKVRESAAFCLAQIFEHHVHVIADAPEKVMGALQSLVAVLASDEAHVSRMAAMGVNNIVAGMAELAEEKAGAFFTPDDKASLISPHFFAIINAMIVRADKEDAEDADLRRELYDTIDSVVQTAARENDAPVLLGLLTDVALARLRASLEALRAPGADRTKQESTQASLAGMVMTLMSTLKEKAAPLIPQVAQVMLAVIDARVAPEPAWFALTSCFSICGNDGDGSAGPYLAEIHPRLLAGLGNVAETSLCRACLYSTADVVRSMGKALPQERAGEYLAATMRVLMDNNAHRDLKPPAMSLLGDMGSVIEPWLNHVLPIIADAVQVPDGDADDEDLAEYLLELRKACMTAWTEIVQSFSADPDAPEAVRSAATARARSTLGAAHGGKLVETIANVIGAWAEKWGRAFAADSDDKPDLDLAKQCIGLICDVVQTFGLDYAAPFFLRHKLNVVWLLNSCEAWEAEEDGCDPKDTTAHYAKKCLGMVKR